MRTRFVVGICVALLASACNDPVSPLSRLATPTQTTTAPTPTLYTVTGVVSEGDRPIEGARFGAWVGDGGSGYACCTGAPGPTLTDAAGRYQLTLPAQMKVWVGASKDGYVTQCAVPPVTLLGDTHVDLQLVSRANLSASTVQAPPTGFRSVSGVISEITGAGRQPVAGAGVDFEPFQDFVAAFTLSDAAGRYLLCGVPEGQTVTIGVGLGGRVTFVSVPSGQSTGIDITLP